MVKKICLLVTMVFAISCTGTALAAVGGGNLTFTPKNAKPVFFSHEKHVDEKHKKCSSCHNHVFQMSKDSNKMDMSKINKGEFCGSCHNGERSFDVKDKASCDRCHK